MTPKAPRAGAPDGVEADRTTCTVRRLPTNTPLQALATLNDEQSFECAKFLALRTLRESTTTADRIRSLFRRATAHVPSEADAKTLQQGLETLLARYRAAPNDAAALLQQGAMPVPDGLDQAELAAWTLLASTVLNLDQSLVKE